MQHAKSQAGSSQRGVDISGLLINSEGYRRWARTAHERSRYVEVMLQMANISNCSDRVTFALMPTPRAFVFVHCFLVFSFHFPKSVSHAFLRFSKVIM